MGSRGGRGRGRFGGGGGFRYAKQEPFILFPDILLPERSNATKEDLELVRYRNRFQLHFKDSPYFLKEKLADEEETADIEKYSDKIKKKYRSSQESLADCGYIKLEPGYFPSELVRGTKRKTGRKVQWNPKRDLKKLDMLEALEQKFKDEDPKSKKEGEDEEEDVEEEQGEDDEDDEDDDYAQNQDFEDDEDGYNDDDDGDAEDLL